jgi:methylated-DNA-[protein]-cysteine S-methyltransferase
MTPVLVSQFHSPIGMILAACRNKRIVKIALPGESGDSARSWLRDRFPNDSLEEGSASILTRLFGQLAGYFNKRLQKFDLAIEFSGTDFQKSVWSALLDIPYGQVVSYGELARRLGKPIGASRAIGSANGANPLPIVVPCHRVIGHSGKLVGYGGGLEIKALLLRLEAQQELLPFDRGRSRNDVLNKSGSPDKSLLRSEATG